MCYKSVTQSPSKAQILCEFTKKKSRKNFHLVNFKMKAKR